MEKKIKITLRPAHKEETVLRQPRPKLLIGIVNKGSGKVVRRILNDVSVGFSFSFTGTGTARSALLDYLGLGETQKTVILALFPETDEGSIMRELRTQMSLYLAGKGIAFTVPLVGISEKIADGLMGAATNKNLEEGKIVKSEERKYNLIVVAVRNEFLDIAVDAARKAGASGGTVIRARSVDNSKAEQFIGVSLVREQEVLFILTKKDSTQAIMDALSESVGLKTPAGGVIFALPVDKTAGISADELEDSHA